jgi:hypothetical protein
MVRIPEEAKDFSLLQIVHTGSVAQPTSYPMSAEGFFAGNKAAGAFS